MQHVHVDASFVATIATDRQCEHVVPAGDAHTATVCLHHCGYDGSRLSQHHQLFREVRGLERQRPKA